MRLIPALDLRHGQVVRLAQGDDERRTHYDLTPADVLASYAEAGVELVHVVDLDAAFGEAPQRDLIAELAALGSPRVELGGGLRDAKAVAWALGAGCERVVLGSLVSRDFAAFAALAEAHPGRIVPALEVGRDAEGRSVLRIAGWRESVATPVDEMSRRLRGLPCPAVLVTDIDRDGTLSGPNLELARSIAEASGIPALLSGGVRSLDDLRRAAQVSEIAGAIVGKALYDGVFTLEDALAACGQAQAPLTDLTCRVIPCLDVKDGRVVKGVRFQNLVDQGDPAEAARRYAEEGADELVFLDITAAPDRRDTDLEWVRRTAEQIFIPLTVGGGVRRVEDAERLLLAGADKVAINSAAIADPELLDRLARRFGSQCVVLSVDALRRTDGALSWQVVTHGGRRPHERDVLAWIAEGVERGAGEILLTSIDSDGTQDGYDLKLLRAARARVTVPIIASGGAGEPRHLADALAAGADAVLAASIFHQGSHPIPEVKRFLAAEGFPIRPEEP